jgi:hypothetical protein
MHDEYDADALEAAWAHQQELEERRRREDAALARARNSTKELRDIINDLNRKGTRHEPERPEL